ncbi:MAG: S8 family serine peptidase [Lactobacillaceae bacterium]|jgi:subtilisin family serine protease|nr:S8 family serine peptidase [Lactobacillaceae bacterium]
MGMWVKKCSSLLLVSILVANASTPVFNVGIYADTTEAPKQTSTLKQSALEIHKAKRAAALKKTWDTKVNAAPKEANKAEAVFVELKDPAAYKDAPEPTGTQANINEIKESVQDVIADQNSVTDKAESITGAEVEQQSGYLVNGFSIQASPKEIVQLEKQPDVLAVYPVHTYQPMDADALELGNAVKAWNSQGVEHKGDGIVIADIDSGIDVHHKDLSTTPPKPALTQATVTKLQTTKKLPGKYFTPKVPYGYNYAENNNEVFDSGINHFHGMHVAGIMAADGTGYVKQKAYDDEMKASGNKTKAEAAKKAARIVGNTDVDGVAPHAQLLAMKVFANNSRGAMTPVIIKAIEDSVMLGADIMNLSLGSVCTDSENDIEEIVLNNAAKLGVLPVVAAGNNGNYAGLHRNGTTEQKAIKEQQTVGAFSSAADAIVVASENNSKKMVDSVKLVDAQTKQDIFKDIKCLQNYTAQQVGFQRYDYYSDKFKDDWLNGGSSTVDGERVSFKIQPVASGVKAARENIDTFFANHPDGDAKLLPEEKMTFNLDPAPFRYSDKINAAKTVNDAKKIYDEYFPTESNSNVNLGRGFTFDYDAPYFLNNGEERPYAYRDNIVMVNQSELSEKQLSDVAKGHMIQGLIVVADDVNAQPGVKTFDDFFETDNSMPAIMINQADAEQLKTYFSTPEGAQKQVQILRTPTRMDSDKAGKLSSYSSWGLTSDLNFKPEITAPGANIWSTINDNQFAEMSGTSMATPFVSGAEALLMQDLKQTKLTGIDKVRAAKVRMENSATPVYETYVKDGKTIKAINSVRQQGAGAINVAKALDNQTLLNVHGKMEGTLSLKQINGSQTIKVDVTNNGKKTKTYTVDGNTGTFYGQTTAPAPDDSQTKVLHEYPIDKAAVSLVPGIKTITVKPGTTQTINLSLNITSKQAKDAWLEGYFGIQEVGSNNTNVLPIVAYYGDLDKETIIDPMSKTANSILDTANLAPEKDMPGYGYGYTEIGENGGLKFNKDDIWYSSNTNVDLGPARKYVYHTVDLTRNAKIMHGYLTDPKGKVLQNGKTINDIGRSYCSGTEVEGNISSADFAWDGEIVDPNSGERRQADEGDYVYHLEATSQLPHAKVQSQKLTIHVDKTKPLATGLKIEKRGNDYFLVGTITDSRAGFGDQCSDHYFYISINNQIDNIPIEELVGNTRTKKIDLNYKLTDAMANLIVDGANSVVFSAMDFANNWIDEAIKFKNGDDQATNFKVTSPARPTIIKAGDKYKRLLEPFEPWSAADPYHVATTYSDIDSYRAGKFYNQAEPDFTNEWNDPINHKIRIEGTSPFSFYVNGQKVVPNNLNHYNVWIKYDPNALDVFRDMSAFPIIYLTFSKDAAGSDIIEKRPVKLLGGSWAAPNLVVDKNDAQNQHEIDWSYMCDDIRRIGAAQDLDADEILASLGLTQWTDFGQSCLVTTNKAELDATFKVTQTSGKVHVINKTAGEQATDSQTIITKPVADSNDATRHLKFSEGLNVIQSYTDEYPDQILTTVVYYSTKKMASEVVTLDNFDVTNLADWNSAKKQYTLRGEVGDKITGIKILGNSTDANDPKNQVTIKDNNWSYAASLDADYGYRTWTMLISMQDGTQRKATIGGFYDFGIPELKFDDATKWKGNDKDGYDVYTNNNTFTFTGTAKDNANGYSVYMNGNFILADQGAQSGNISQGTPNRFCETYNLAKNHMTDFEWKIMDRMNNYRFVHIRVHQGKS